MKKYLPLIFIAFLAPQIAFAVWWNPFTWKIFNRGNSTQQFEERIKYLEQKLYEKNATTSGSIEDKKVPTSSKTQTTVDIDSKSGSVPTTNTNDQSYQYKKIIMGKIADAYATSETYAKYSDTIISIINNRNNDLDNIISRNKSFASQVNDEFMSSVAESFNELHSIDISSGKSSITVLEAYKKEFNRMLPLISTDATNLSNKPSMSKAEFDQLSNEYDQVNIRLKKLVSDQQNQVYVYQDWVKRVTADYRNNLSMLKTKLETSISYSSYSPSIQYIPPNVMNVPVFTPPRSTHCNVNPSYGGGGTISCTTY